MITIKKLYYTKAPASVILIRLVVGLIFLSEGIQKFLFADDLGVGRFVKIGMPAPEIMANFVGSVEILCGLLIIIGLFTRLSSIPLIIDMIVAIIVTKVPMIATKGFWSMAHEARVDFAMLLGCLFLLIVGAGSVSIDAIKSRKDQRPI